MQRHGPIRSLRDTLTIQCVQMENIKHINESQLKSFYMISTKNAITTSRMQDKYARNSELTKQTVDRKQKFTPIPFVDKLSLCVAKSLLRSPKKYQKPWC